MDDHSQGTGAINGDAGDKAGPRSGGAKQSQRSRAGRKRRVRGSGRNTGRAERVIRFLEKLNVEPGKPLVLEDFQKDFIRDVYEPGEERRTVRRAILSVGSGNGKSTLTAGLALCHLIGPEAVYNAEIYSAANEREQAGIIYKYAEQMIEATPQLKRYLKQVPSTKTLVVPHLGGFYRAISREAASHHGLNPTMVIYDELAQAKNRELYDALDTKLVKRDEALFVTISTQSPDPEHIMSKLVDDGLSADDPTTVCHLYAADDDAELDDDKQWRKANPGLGVFVNEDEFKAQAGKAMRMPTFENAFRNLHLNQRVSVETPLIPRAEWEACKGEVEFEPGERVYLGLDLAVTTDLAALAMVSAENGSRARLWFWKPEERVEEHKRRDRVPYDVWAREGWLTLCPSRTIDYGMVAQVISDLCNEYSVEWMAYDRYKIEYLQKAFDAIGFQVQKGEGDGLNIKDWGQGFTGMEPGVAALEKAVLERELVHDGNPILTWNIANAITVTGPSGDRKFDKDKARFRIDGAVALAECLGVKATMQELETPISPWEDENFRITV